jgi:hypothetical protein
MATNKPFLMIQGTPFPAALARRVKNQCIACDNTGWVCEDHPDRPADCGNSPRACACGAAGGPCLVCNGRTPGGRRRLPSGFVARNDAVH